MNAWNRRCGPWASIKDSEVVIYSNPFDNWGDEGRMFWMLEYFGHTKHAHSRRWLGQVGAGEAAV